MPDSSLDADVPHARCAAAVGRRLASLVGHARTMDAIRRLLMNAIFALAPAIAPGVAIAATDESLPEKITFKPGYFDNEFNPLRSRSRPNIVLLRIPVIAGSTFGEISTPDVIQVKIGVGEPTTLDLGRVGAAVDRLAAPLTKEAAQAGLVVTPIEARFARFAPLVAYPDTGKGVGGAKFQSAERDQTLLIVYFDRPCRMSGVIKTKTSSIIYDVQIARRGMHMLQVVRDGSSNVRVSRTTLPSMLVLGITPSR